MWLAQRGRGLLLAFAMALVFMACATPSPVDPQVVAQSSTHESQEPLPVGPEPPPLAPTETATEEYRVSEEVYTQTFDELEEHIQRWNALIARNDYDGWFAALSTTYVTERSSPTYLAELSRSQRLRGNGIVLRTLRDYFYAVVVPARVDASLGKIEFVGPSKVKAYAVIEGEPAILYYVVRENGSWRIGTSSEMALDRSLG